MYTPGHLTSRAAHMASLDGGLPVLSSPNPENKLFVGGAPPGCDETTLQQVQPQACRLAYTTQQSFDPSRERLASVK